MIQNAGNADVPSKGGNAIEIQADLNPLIESIPKALDMIFTILFKSRYENAKRRALLTAAQNKVDAEKIIEGNAIFTQENGVLLETADGYKKIQRLLIDLLQEEEIINIIKCGLHAASNIQDVPIHETENSPEFLSRWTKEARFISENEAQAMWGRVLSEEINFPKSISIRTLDVIKNLKLSKRLANLSLTVSICWTLAA